MVKNEDVCCGNGLGEKMRDVAMAVKFVYGWSCKSGEGKNHECMCLLKGIR